MRCTLVSSRKGTTPSELPCCLPAEMGESLPRVSWISKHEPVSEVLKGAELTPGRMKRTTALLSSFVIRDRNRYCTCSTAAQTWMGLPSPPCLENSIQIYRREGMTRVAPRISSRPSFRRCRAESRGCARESRYSFDSRTRLVASYRMSLY